MGGIGRTQHCVALSMTMAEYAAMAEGVKEGGFVRLFLSFAQPGVAFLIETLEDKRGASQ